MKAIDINGEIKIYSQLPKSWGNIIGGFNTLSDEEAKEYGFYDVVSPDYDNAVEILGDIYFDSDNEVFTYSVENIVFNETLSELKESKIESLRNYTNKKLAETDWYVIRNAERSIDIPQDIQDVRAAILSNHDTSESEINALSTKKSVVSYEFI
jgi:hypothetical protein